MQWVSSPRADARGQATPGLARHSTRLVRPLRGVGVVWEASGWSDGIDLEGLVAIFRCPVFIETGGLPRSILVAHVREPGIFALLRIVPRGKASALLIFRAATTALPPV